MFEGEGCEPRARISTGDRRCFYRLSAMRKTAFNATGTLYWQGFQHCVIKIEGFCCRTSRMLATGYRRCFIPAIGDVRSTYPQLTENDRLSAMFPPAIGDVVYRLSAMRFTGYHRCQRPRMPAMARGLKCLTRARALTVLFNALTAPPSWGLRPRRARRLCRPRPPGIPQIEALRARTTQNNPAALSPQPPRRHRFPKAEKGVFRGAGVTDGSCLSCNTLLTEPSVGGGKIRCATMHRLYKPTYHR
jgi:hypothetical protein